jgi:hypothetical protein
LKISIPEKGKKLQHKVPMAKAKEDNQDIEGWNQT